MGALVRLSGEQFLEELDLEMSGDIASLQRYRLDVWLKLYHKSNPADMRAPLQTELELRENTQREIALGEDIQELLEIPTTHDISTRILRLQSENSDLSKQHWMLEREWWKIRRSFVDGSLTRGIDFWRSYPRWYMHSVVFVDCAEGEDAVHATADAVLIALDETFRLVIAQWNARGFKLDPKQKAQIQEAFKLGGSSDHRIRNAALLGLVSGSWEHPLDHVQQDQEP
ncbi:hypothetical protein N7447_002706 [Penicillium robsamsonii]|uniref:uncharacterized protein n=1 Tax=Penicillium robsamsonii TaxID=1792511 RepID=UPI002548DA53|nr:uncharacterized protein N7447_002706 [Penicillium robsamsonii]KAJ5836680.1 hypothetical protein N7447_002706 [Penicillium robsamsonii]